MNKFFETGWIEPVKLAEKYYQQFKHFSFLFSSLRNENKPHFSYLGLGCAEISETLPSGQGLWIGYSPYNHMKNNGFWAKHSVVYRWDHSNKKMYILGELPPTSAQNQTSAAKIPVIKELICSLDKHDYLQRFFSLKESILNGEIYQANLTRKWSGNFEDKPDALLIFKKLIDESPSPYSALITHENISIISSSPEMFMKISEDGLITCCPIKGTAARGASKDDDLININRLKGNTKELAENLMITDLIRNDISISAIPDTVKVESLQEITTYPSIHHMSSTITGQKLPDLGVVDVLENSLPVGSMTGTPKIQAVKILDKLEPVERGIYSGVLGWIDSNVTSELSVIIRSIIIKGKEFEFSAGGGIVADSEAESEYKETLLKATPIAKVLGISDLK